MLRGRSKVHALGTNSLIYDRLHAGPGFQPEWRTARLRSATRMATTRAIAGPPFGR